MSRSRVERLTAAVRIVAGRPRPALPTAYILRPGNKEKYTLFCQGFADRRPALIGPEDRLAAQYKKNLAVYRKQSAQRAAPRQDTGNRQS